MSVLAKIFPLWFDGEYRAAKQRVHGSVWATEHSQERGTVTSISGLMSRAAALESNHAVNGMETALLRQEVDRLQLVVSALVEVIEARIGVPQEELELMVERIDLADGRPDGRIDQNEFKNALRCPACVKPVNPERSECIYCGESYAVEALKADRAELEARANQQEQAAHKARLVKITEAKKRRAEKFVAMCIECAKPIPDESEVAFTVRGVMHPHCVR